MRSLPANRRAWLSGLLLALVAVPQLSRATVIDCGPTVCFQYDETQAAISGLGVPVRVGDAMQFLPPSVLLVSASGAAAPDLSFSFVFDRVFSVSGGEISLLRVFEEGDYEIIGGGMVGSRLEIQAQSNLAAEEAIAAAVFGDSGDSGVAQLWDLEVAVAPAAAFTGPATDVRLTIGNLLQAGTTGFGELAWIQKKFILGTAEVAPVPVPGTLWLFATGAGLCGWLAKRRRTA